jgi:hypothetical protein
MNSASHDSILRVGTVGAIPREEGLCFNESMLVSDELGSE